MIRRLVLLSLALTALTLITGCGSSDESDSGYVSILEAKFFFEGYFGGRWSCEGHEPPDPSEPLVNAKLAEEIEDAKGRVRALPFGFVSCRLLSGGSKRAHENGVTPGSTLTYGFP